MWTQIKTRIKKIVKARDLQLGDVVKKKGTSHSYDYSTVKQIDGDRVVLFRPFVVTEDFSYTGGVPCYIGISIYSVDRDDTDYILFERKEVRK